MGSAFKFINEDNPKKAVLLFHGLTGSPFEMKKFGKFLSEHGYDVYGACLPGHGEFKSDIYTVCYDDWLNYAFEQFEKLCGDCRGTLVLCLLDFIRFLDIIMNILNVNLMV